MKDNERIWEREKEQTSKRERLMTFIPMDKFSTALSGLILFLVSVMARRGFTVPLAASDIFTLHVELAIGCLLLFGASKSKGKIKHKERKETKEGEA